MYQDTVWADTKPSMITSCFKNCGSVTTEYDTATEEDTEDDLPLSSFIPRLSDYALTFNKFADVDN